MAVLSQGDYDALHRSIVVARSQLQDALKTLAQIESNAKAMTYEPCRKCGRRVPSPCHDDEGYHEGGPWDFACKGYFYPERCD